MSTNDKVIVKKIQKEGETKRRSNHVTYERLDGTEKYRIKGKKVEPPKPKPVREILDNYRYIETKYFKKNDRESIVRHKRLGEPIGKETPYEGKIYNTETNYAPKRPKISDTILSQKTYNPKDAKKTTSTSNVKNTTQTYKKTTYEAKKYTQKANIASNQNKQNISVNYNKGQNQQNTQVNKTQTQSQQKQTKYTLNQGIGKNTQINQTKTQYQLNTQNIQKTSLNQPYAQKGQQTKKYEINQKNVQNSYLKKNINESNKNENIAEQTKQQINKNQQQQMNMNQFEQNNIFNSPQQKVSGMGEYGKYKSQTEKIVICRTCGKPKRPRNAQSAEKSGKIVSKEIIGEEKSANNYVIRYGNENDNIQKDQRFETYRAPGTHFCPVHGYV